MHAFYTYLQHSAVAAGHVDKVSDRLARPGGTRVPLLSVAGGIFPIICPAWESTD